MGSLPSKEQKINEEKKNQSFPNPYFPPQQGYNHPEMYLPNNPFPTSALPPMPNPDLYRLNRSEVKRNLNKEKPFLPYQNFGKQPQLESNHSRNQLQGYNTQIYSPPSQIHYPPHNYSRISISPIQRENITLAHPLSIAQQNVFHNPMRKAGPPKVTTETFNSPGGLGRRTIIEEPFEIEQAPKLQKVRTIVNRPISIPQPPDTHVIEEIIESPVIVHPPPQKQIIREVIERPISIPQPPEKRIIREVIKRPIQIQPPPERKVIHDIIRRSVLVDQPPKSIMIRKEYEEPPRFFGEVPVMSNLQETMIPETFAYQPIGNPISHHTNLAIPTMQNVGITANPVFTDNADPLSLRYQMNQPYSLIPPLSFQPLPDFSNNIPLEPILLKGERPDELPFQPEPMTNLGAIPLPSPPPPNPMPPIPYDIMKDNLLHPKQIIPENSSIAHPVPPNELIL